MLAPGHTAAYAKTMKKPRLTRQSWIDAGLEALISEGPSALAAEPLARRMGTTKGSFYWHFNDVPDFQTAVAASWQTQAFANVVQALAEPGTPEQRLRRFGRHVLADQQDQALRAWAQTDQRILEMVVAVDAERLTYLGNLLRHLGITNPDFAAAALGAVIGMPQLPGVKNPDDAFDTLIDLVLALQ